MHKATPLRGRDIVCVGFADWDTDLWTNQHHLMSRLAQENRVLFVESLGLRMPTLASRDVSRMIRRLRRGLAAPRAVDGLHAVSPLILPIHRYRLVRALNRRLLPAVVHRAARHLGIERPILWAYVPQAEELIEVLDPSLVVYHCVDDIAAQAGVDAPSFRAAESRFASRADLVLASAPSLAERMGQLSRNVIYAPNVADTTLFAGALDPGPIDRALDELAHPRIVFTGAIVRTKLDFDLLVEIARSRPDWSIALVGPVGVGDPSTDASMLETEPNVHMLGPRPYRELPAVLRGADVGIIPYAINQLTESVFPMKVYEYLAAGLPVVATPLPSISGVADLATAPDANAFVAAIEKALASDSPSSRAQRSRAAAAHSWDERLSRIATAIDALEREHREQR